MANKIITFGGKALTGLGNKVVAFGAQKPMIFEIETTTANKLVQIPHTSDNTTDAFNYDITWGGGA